MELLFVYDDKVAQDSEGNYYVGSAFSQEVFDRYLEHFDRLTLIMRRADVRPDDTEALGRMNRISSERISVVFIPNTLSGIRSFLSLRLRRQIKKTVEENITPDRAVVIRMSSYSGAIAAKYCRRIGKPLLVEAVGCPWGSLWNHSLFGKLLAPFSYLRMRRTMKHAPFSVYVTEEFLQRRYPTEGRSAAISDVELIPADDEVLHRRLDKISGMGERIKLGTGAAVNVAFKGQRFVIEALHMLREQGDTRFEYHLAGGGDNTALRELAERLGVSDQVIFEGSLPHDKMFAWLDGLDVYIQPSLQEGLPRAVVEAMSRGLPCLVSKTGGMPELVGETAIFGRGDVRAIVKMLSDLTPDRLCETAKANFERAKDFDREKLTERRRSFYGEFAKEARDVGA